MLGFDKEKAMQLFLDDRDRAHRMKELELADKREERAHFERMREMELKAQQEVREAKEMELKAQREEREAKDDDCENMLQSGLLTLGSFFFASLATVAIYEIIATHFFPHPTSMQRYFEIVIEQTIWTAAIFQINSIFGSGGCVSSYIISIFRRNKVTTEASTSRQEVEESSLSLLQANDDAEL
eukprot:CAMPEP_0170078482 /NCGR_PEP_ID=MMETSP0019_2-20121128/15052_1 /TAXON_ID=98059 /ORGANISM="Dinobryon sp., Strain UTEXLB2267" /LENGTH=183 /DNA_ID=CAMNT_0010291361 /DNA_START=30 /DNA_END=581 /DNA_ORIENTATION=+